VLGDRFRMTFRLQSRADVREGSALDLDPQVHDVVAALGGCVAHDGLYRVHAPTEVVDRTRMVEAAMPEVRGRVVCFGEDWLGGQFALDRTRVDGGDNLVLLLEPGTGELLEIPATVRLFHDTELVSSPDAALGAAFYAEWRTSTGDDRPIEDGTCVGYRVPLFLGGADTVANLERTDLAVYWHLAGELRATTRNVLPGTPMGSVDIDE
jgi:hypothetical protein